MGKKSFLNKIGNVFKGIQIFAQNDWKSFFQYINGGLEEDSGQEVTPETGTRVGVIFNCLNVLGQDITTMPKQVRQNSEDGTKIISSPLSKLLNGKPNNWENAWHFWYGLVFVGEGWGNSYAYISKRDSKGYAIEAFRLKPWLVVPEIIEGELFYVVDNKVTIPEYEMIHYRSMVTDSCIGEQKIVYNAKTVGLKMKQQKYSAKSVGSKPPGYLQGTMTEAQLTANGKNWKEQISGDNIAGTPVLNGEINYHQLMMSPEATEIVLQNELSDQYLMGIWRMQPSMLSIHKESNYNVVEQQNITHVRATLMPIITNLEQEINNKLFPAKNEKSEFPEFVKFNVKSLLRGDTATQTAFYQFMITSGVGNADMVLDWEDLPPQRDSNGKIGIGQRYMIQGAMVDKENLINNPPNNESEEVSNQSDQKSIDLLEGFLKKHKLNGYSVNEKA